MVCRYFLFSFAVMILLIAIPAAAESPFIDLTLEEALTRAEAEKKLVFIDFHATWCGPCKQLDSTTFADSEVQAWLARHTVPLKVDVDKEKDVARRFKVSSMPTLIFLRPDGAELERILGFRTSDQFLKTAESVVEHPDKDAVTRAREELEEGLWPEAMSRQKLAMALVACGKSEEALGEYRKAMDSLGDDTMSRQFRARLLQEICAMGQNHPPAGEAMQSLRAELVKRLEAGETDDHLLDQITSIDQGLDQRSKTVELYYQLKERGDVSASLLSRLARSCREQMLADRQYEALEAESRGGMLYEALRDIMLLEKQRAWAGGDFEDLPAERAKIVKQRYDAMSEEERASFKTGFEEHGRNKIGECYQIALGVGKTDDAATIARKLLKLLPGPDTCHVLAHNALVSGKPTEADLGYATKAVELDRGEHPEYVLTRFELQAFFAGGDEAADQGGEAELPTASP